jgi:hypothetical protein
MNRMLVGVVAVGMTLGGVGCATKCGPSNCGGCCDPSGLCEAPSASFCGLGGNVCTACAPVQACLAGVCGFEAGTIGGSTGSTTSTASTTSSSGTSHPASTSSGATSPGATSVGASSGGASTNTSTNTSTSGTSSPASTTSSGASTSTGACTNLQCDVQACPNGAHTTISGTITDPAGIDPLFAVVAYVPNAPVDALVSGATCDSCASLFSGQPMAVGLSDENGHFVIQDAPVSTNVPVIVQTGKWRTHTTVSTITACVDNPVGTLKFPAKMDATDPVLNMPDIAVSTGSADSLECLLVRVGIDSSEYVAGASTLGKVHIFNGGSSSPAGTGVGGAPESNPMVGAPGSDQALWNSASSLAAYDMVLLSCEGDETYDAQPANLAAYLNSGGGRVFASHFHYAWFTGATEGQTPSYTSPSAWGSAGNALATWTTGAGTSTGTSANGVVVTAGASGRPFPKGPSFAAWLSNMRALGTSGAPPGDLYVAQPRDNAVVTAADTSSQGWLDDAANNSTLYFSFNTPLGQTASSCPGRAIFSGLHVGGASFDSVNCAAPFGCPSGSPPAAPPPAGCDTAHGLSPQEKALEFMLFDLSSCIIPDTAYPADAGIVPPLSAP